MPAIIGGLNSLQNNLIYPQQALANNIAGKVYVFAMIDTDGVLLCTKIIKELGFGCDEEAIRLVSEAKFYPGYVRKKPVKVPIAIPIIFRLPTNTK